MGKSRQGTKSQEIQNTQEFLNNLAHKISRWESSGLNEPLADMTDEEKNYIREHEEVFNPRNFPINHLYRLERPSHYNDSLNLDDIEKQLHVGDILNDAEYRSFSDDAYAHYIYTSSHPWSSAVIVRTNGAISQFNPRKLADVYSSEKEVWVNKNKLKIEKLTRLKGDNISEDFQKELGINSMYDVAMDDILIIDVSSA